MVVAHHEALLDYFEDVRGILGDERFVTFLGRASPEFAAMRRALGETVTPEVAYGLWRLRRRQDLAFRKSGFTTQQQQRELVPQSRAEARALLGEAGYARYCDDNDSRWLQSGR